MGRTRDADGLRPAPSWSSDTSPRWPRSTRSPSRMRTGVEGDGVTREGMDRTRTSGPARPRRSLLRVRSADGTIAEIAARAVIDASGTYRVAEQPGLVRTGAARPGRGRRPGQPRAPRRSRAATGSASPAAHTTVVGAGHSAANTLLNLASLAADEPARRITWVIRNAVRCVSRRRPTTNSTARASLGARVDALVASGGSRCSTGSRSSGLAARRRGASRRASQRRASHTSTPTSS